MRDKDNKLLIICFLILMLTGGVIYALLQAKLNIVGTAKIEAADWDIHFNNLNLIEKSGKAEVMSASLSTATIQLDIELKEPLDAVLYSFDVINDGDLDAKISDVILPNLKHLKDNYIIYELTYENGDSVQTGDTLAVGVTKTLNLFVQYAEVSDPDILNALGEFSEELSATILYVQA